PTLFWGQLTLVISKYLIEKTNFIVKIQKIILMTLIKYLLSEAGDFICVILSNNKLKEKRNKNRNNLMDISLPFMTGKSVVHLFFTKVLGDVTLPGNLFTDFTYIGVQLSDFWLNISGRVVGLWQWNKILDEPPSARDKNILITEQSTKDHVRAMEERLRVAEQKQVQMMGFLARAMRNPEKEGGPLTTHHSTGPTYTVLHFGDVESSGKDTEIHTRY
ncbi:hypothetical protein ACJX0J_009356, partial [Zea mays]